MTLVEKFSKNSKLTWVTLVTLCTSHHKYVRMRCQRPPAMNTDRTEQSLISECAID